MAMMPPVGNEGESLLDGLGILDFGNISGYGIGVMCFLALLRGWIFTRAHYNDITSQRDKWEAAFWKSQEASALKDAQNIELLETARNMKHFMEAFPRATQSEEGSK